ncbi:hypothetical protein ACFQ48_19245 [Hymenobacter caeli]|uniref:Uncharacterized protein n=1 Tax=Hymenobacter caeli TaxID=2735894 RepID=A0ABX2FX54_9BACT|nr:hypothetical protein [Hymenobacter caeli]NRT21036.1 hypothetical protein [Hymenobacter caeli]
METIMLITGSSESLPYFKQTIGDALPKSTVTDQGDPTVGFIVQNAGSNRLYVDYCGNDLISIGWNESEIDWISQQFPAEYYAYSIQYRTINTVKKILVRIANSDQILVDNDCGQLMKGTDFVTEIINNPEWNWLKDLSKQ